MSWGRVSYPTVPSLHFWLRESVGKRKWLDFLYQSAWGGLLYSSGNRNSELLLWGDQIRFGGWGWGEWVSSLGNETGSYNDIRILWAPNHPGPTCMTWKPGVQVGIEENEGNLWDPSDLTCWPTVGLWMRLQFQPSPSWVRARESFLASWPQYLLG